MLVGSRIMRTWQLSAFTVAAAVLAACNTPQKSIANGDAVVGGNGAVNLEQGWSREVQERAWFTSFGSRLIPTAWLKVLEQASNQERFMADTHLDALGFLIQSSTAQNPNACPVGFTHETDAQGR